LYQEVSLDGIYTIRPFSLVSGMYKCYNINRINGGTKRGRKFTIDSRSGLLRQKNKYWWRFIMRSERIMTKTENVIKIWLLGFAFIIIGLGGSNAFALDLMGPPTAELEKDMFSVGLEYSFGKMDVDLIEGKAVVYRNGELLGSGTAQSIKVKNFKVNTLYATFGYGMTENAEAFIRMGAANAEFGDSLWEENEDFESKYNFAIGVGLKATLYEGFDWKVGGLFQVNRTELDGEIDSSSWSIAQPHFAEISTTEMQIAIGATYLYSDRISIYGGPFAHYISGDFDYEFTRITTDIDTGEFEWEIKEGPTYGGYIGAMYKFAKNSSANIEYQQTSDAEVFGISVMMRY